MAVVLVHHAGKNKREQRGTSAHGDNVDNIIFLTRPEGWDMSSGSFFRINYDKMRNAPPGANLNTFKVKLVNKTGGVEWKESN